MRTPTLRALCECKTAWLLVFKSRGIFWLYICWSYCDQLQNYSNQNYSKWFIQHFNILFLTLYIKQSYIKHDLLIMAQIEWSHYVVFDLRTWIVSSFVHAELRITLKKNSPLKTFSGRIFLCAVVSSKLTCWRVSLSCFLKFIFCQPVEYY